MEEIVSVYDEQGVPVGAAPRSRVRAENLRHGSTAVVVRNSKGKIFVHRRTATKDIFPNLYDFAAGGLILDGETPLEGAYRELGEELDITTATLEPVAERDYEDEQTRYRAYLYTTTWDGPVHPQREEVDWCGWMSMKDLRKALGSPEWDFAPDSVALWNGFLTDDTGAA
ncbi:MAG: NUDIX hydrolase [Micrococcales bacterium]|nr:MAG: NUDIX hydrolase [Micrococcales bacterium]PIE26803.1 MAG: NUDIX hydrolase [Micrococcales bacterium]